MIAADLEVALASIERAAKYAQTSGDLVAAHNAREAARVLEGEVRSKDNYVDRATTSEAWRSQAQVVIERLRAEIHLLREQITQDRARMEHVERESAQALASVLRSKSRRTQLGALVDRIVVEARDRRRR